MNKRTVRVSFLILVVLVCVQLITYYLFAKSSLIYSIGNHYETFVFSSGNKFEEIMIGANVPLKEEKVIASFPVFEEYKIRLCEALPQKCIDGYDWNKKGRYQYFFEIKTDGPLAIHTVEEFEHASQYGAAWESVYVWIIYKWVLITKESRGMS